MMAATPAPVAGADAVFNALGDPTRRAMIAALSFSPASVSELAAQLDITKTAVGQHLAILEGCHMASSAKVGRVRTCRVDPRGLRLASDWVEFHRRQWDDALDRLGDMLDED